MNTKQTLVINSSNVICEDGSILPINITNNYVLNHATTEQLKDLARHNRNLAHSLSRMGDVKGAEHAEMCADFYYN